MELTLTFTLLQHRLFCFLWSLPFNSNHYNRTDNGQRNYLPEHTALYATTALDLNYTSQHKRTLFSPSIRALPRLAHGHQARQCVAATKATLWSVVSSGPSWQTWTTYLWGRTVNRGELSLAASRKTKTTMQHDSHSCDQRLGHFFACEAVITRWLWKPGEKISFLCQNNNFKSTFQYCFK